MTFAKQVWDTLSKVNVADKLMERNGLKYLSWSDAWQLLMEYYPCSRYEIGQDVHDMVRIAVTVSDGDNELTRDMWLPLMDDAGRPIVNGNAVDTNRARMRALVKCIAMFGLGLSAYQEREVEEIRTVDDAINDIKAADTVDDVRRIYAKFARGVTAGDKKMLLIVAKERQKSIEEGGQ